MNKVILFTHTDLDGVGCGILARVYFVLLGYDVEVIYCNYDNIDAEVSKYLMRPNTANDIVLITDISVSQGVADRLAYSRQLRMIRLFDHHESAIDLNKYTWARVLVKYENGHKASGTSLFNSFLKSSFPLPEKFDSVTKNCTLFAEYVRLYDTYEFKVTGEKIPKNLCDLLSIMGKYDFDKAMIPKIMSDRPIECISKFEARLLEYRQKEIDNYIYRSSFNLKILNDDVGYIISDRFVSELGNSLCEKNPTMKYIKCIDINAGTVSMRTVKDDINLSDIAKHYGGGGHQKAAGYPIKSDTTVLAFIEEKARGDF